MAATTKFCRSDYVYLLSDYVFYALNVLQLMKTHVLPHIIQNLTALEAKIQISCVICAGKRLLGKKLG